MSIAGEERSFAPRRGRAVKRPPLPENPDNGQLGQAIRDVEECVHEASKASLAAIARHRAASDKRLATMSRRLGKMEAMQGAIRLAIGLDDKGNVVRRTPLTMSRFEAIATLGGVVTVAVGGVQLVIHLWPGLALLARELWAWVAR
jgi:hypothetical protein